MMKNRMMHWFSFAVIALVSTAQVKSATIPITNWAVHNSNGSITVADAGTSSPTVTAADLAADTMTIMAPFTAVTLANNGDYIKLTTTLTMTGRTTTGVNTLNTHLRFGLFDGPAGGIMGGDAPNYGILAQYANSNQGHLKVFEQNTAAVDPMNPAPTLIGEQPTNVTVDPENDAIQGATATAAYEMTITRSAGNLAITGSITGGSYLSSFNIPAFSSATFPANGSFTFDRVGFHLGNNVNAATGSTFANVTIETNVPEPVSCSLAATCLFGSALLRRRER